MKTHPSANRLRKIAAALGSTAETPKGILKFLRTTTTAQRNDAIKSVSGQSWIKAYLTRRAVNSAKKGDTITMLGVPSGYMGIRIADINQKSLAIKTARKNNPRKRNLYGGSPKRIGPAVQEREEKIHYKGHYKGYSGSEIFADYQSAVFISRSGKSACLIVGCVFLRRILAPKGMVWKIDANGAALKRTSDSMDYHPTREDWDAKNFATIVREWMAKNFFLRREAARKTKNAARISAIFERDLKTTRVTLSDSRRAGNCIAGTLAWCERKMGLSREEILGGSFLFSVRADKLRAKENGNAAKVEAAIKTAWLRETIVSI